MKKLAIATLAFGLMLLAAPKSDACSTHGYVRASTLNDLFNGVAQAGELEFRATDASGAGADGKNLSDPHLLDNNHYDDGHAFGWKMKGVNNDQWFSLSTINDPRDAHTMLDDIIATIETNMSENYDKNYAD